MKKKNKKSSIFSPDRRRKPVTVTDILSSAVLYIRRNSTDTLLFRKAFGSIFGSIFTFLFVRI